MALACACAGIVIGVVTLSGLGIVFTQLVVGLAQDTLLLALILTMVAGIVLGMGMPTTPAYIIMTSLLVPAIIKLGVDPAGRAHVRVLLRGALRHHAAGRARGLRGGRARQVRPLEGGLGGGEDRRGRLHRALHVRLRAGPADDRRPGRTIIWRFVMSTAASGCSRLVCTAISSRAMPMWQRGVLVAAVLLVVPGSPPTSPGSR